MTLSAFLGSALPYVFGLLVACGAWLYFNKFQPWYHRVFLPWYKRFVAKLRNRRRERKAWDIHAR